MAAITLEDIEKLPREWLTAEDVAGYLDAHPQTIRDQAKDDPAKLGFSVIVCGSRVKIPKDAFIYYCRYGRPSISTDIGLDAVKYFIEQAMDKMLSPSKGTSKYETPNGDQLRRR